MLQRYKLEIARALPKHLSAERMARIALTSFRRNPKLGQCDPKSVFAAVVMAAQLGWEVGIGGQAYLVPYGRECQLVPGWLGLTDLVFRAGKAAVWTGAVYEGDEFDYGLGDSPFLNHRPSDTSTDRLLAVYAIGRTKDSNWPVVEVWPLAKVIAHRDRYNKVGKLHYSFQHFEMYARKVALLQVLKYMPKSAELNTAMQLDQSAGNQNLKLAEVIDSTWMPESEPEPQAPVHEEPRKGATEAVKEKLKSMQPASPEQVDDAWPKDPKDAA